MPKPAAIKRTTVRIPDDIKARIKVLAEREDRSEAAMMVMLLRRALRRRDQSEPTLDELLA